LKIEPSGIQRLLNAYKVDKPSMPQKKQKSDQIDEVTVSDFAQTFHVAFKAAMETADSQTAKVERLKALYDAGQYNVDASKVAESIIAQVLGKK